MSRNWTAEQKKVLAWFAGEQRGTKHLVVRARAGTGKTTTIIEGVKLSQELAKDGQVLIAAFSKAIGLELQGRLKGTSGIEAMTLHSLGYSACRRARPGCRIDERGDQEKALAARAIQGLSRKAPLSLVSQVRKLGSWAKATLLYTAADLYAAVGRCGLELDEGLTEAGWGASFLADATEAYLVLAQEQTGPISFDDMVWLPVVNHWPVTRYDLVVIDEAQDMNRAQLELAMAAAGKQGTIVTVGDDRQAIFGFRGADSAAIDRIKKTLQAEELTLTLTHRCPKLVVGQAQTYVSDFRTTEEAPEGTLAWLEGQAELLKALEGAYERAKASGLEKGPFVISRKNAPLAKLALRLLRQGIPGRIAGRQDAAAEIKGLIQRLNARDLPDLLRRASQWRKREVEKAEASENENRSVYVQDLFETLEALSDGCTGIRELEARIGDLYQDGTGLWVSLTSVHRSKGLETEEVFLLWDTFFLKHRRADKVEEENLAYVGITRAKKVLYYVEDDPSPPANI